MSYWLSVSYFESHARRERTCHDEPPVHERERQRRQTSRRWTVGHARGVSRIELRLVALTVDQLLVGQPTPHVATGMRADGGVRDDPARRHRVLRHLHAFRLRRGEL